MTGLLRAVQVVQQRWEADGVVSLSLRATDEQPLPPWEPGAHIDLALPSGRVRQYSLCGQPDGREYTVAVLREPVGRGGSSEIHDTALIGRHLQIRGPHNRFELEPSPAYVFIAGGIGITPLLTMIRDVVERGVPWELHYGGRCHGSMAFTAELAELAQRSYGRLHLYSDDVDGALPLAEIIRQASNDAEVYACGPSGMLTALAETVGRERPDMPLRFERFTAAPTDTPPADAGGTDDGQAPFEIELAQTGETVTVHPGQSILDAIRAKRPDVLSSCEEGFCGTCETKVLEGRPIHRDTILTDKEREKSTTMMICVGGCASARLVLDL